MPTLPWCHRGSQQRGPAAVSPVHDPDTVSPKGWLVTPCLCHHQDVHTLPPTLGERPLPGVCLAPWSHMVFAVLVGTFCC